MSSQDQIKLGVFLPAPVSWQGFRTFLIVCQCQPHSFNAWRRHKQSPFSTQLLLHLILLLPLKIQCIQTVFDQSSLHMCVRATSDKQNHTLKAKGKPQSYSLRFSYYTTGLYTIITMAMVEQWEIYVQATGVSPRPIGDLRDWGLDLGVPLTLPSY